MFPQRLIAALYWWTRHPWTAFWAFALADALTVLAMDAFGVAGYELGARLVLLPLMFVCYASFVQGVRVSWRRSKIVAVVPVVGLLLLGQVVASFFASRGQGNVPGFVVQALPIVLAVGVPIVTEVVVRHIQRRRELAPPAR